MKDRQTSTPAAAATADGRPAKPLSTEDFNMVGDLVRERWRRHVVDGALELTVRVVTATGRKPGS